MEGEGVGGRVEDSDIVSFWGGGRRCAGVLDAAIVALEVVVRSRALVGLGWFGGGGVGCEREGRDGDTTGRSWRKVVN